MNSFFMPYTTFRLNYSHSCILRLDNFNFIPAEGAEHLIVIDEAANWDTIHARYSATKNTIYLKG